MLGRICMTLQPADIVCAVTDDPSVKIKYMEMKNVDLKYEPSYNIAPGGLAPIVIAANHFKNTENIDYIIIPSLWGLIPHWHKGNYREHGFNTTNFRVENLDESRMYKPAFSRGQRCVLICEGYYEHLRVPYRLPPEQRPIYYVYSKQIKGIEIHNKSTWTCREINLLYIAGLFDIWTKADGNKIFNFTILSIDSDQNSLSWLHPRTPVILETSEQISNWLNFNQIPPEHALNVIKSPTRVIWHRVSNHVIDVTNKDSKCNKPIKVGHESDDNED